MKKTIILISILLIEATSLLAENITREQANAIVLGYLQDKVTRPYFLSVNINPPNEEGIVLTTYNGEIIKAKYACWVYFFDEYSDVNGPYQRRYLFVKEDNGALMEIIINHDFGPSGGAAAWMVLKTPSGLVEPKENDMQLYPNPVNDLLTFPCNGESVRVEIYDLKGTRLFSGLSPGKDSCQLDVSFLSAGVYVVNVEGENFKIIKK